MGIKISIRQMVKLHLKSPSLLECFYAKYFTMFVGKSKYGDFNPHLLYIGKKVPEVSGEDHSHDYLELTYILSGKARYYIEGKEYLLHPGDLLVGNPGACASF